MLNYVSQSNLRRVAYAAPVMAPNIIHTPLGILLIVHCRQYTHGFLNRWLGKEKNYDEHVFAKSFNAGASGAAGSTWPSISS